jgi:hypothetical protein
VPCVEFGPDVQLPAELLLMFQLVLGADTVNEIDVPTVVLTDVGLIVRAASRLAGNSTAKANQNLNKTGAPMGSGCKS